MNDMVGKILMVDDDIDDYGFLREALSCIDSKIECHHAGDGEHAFNALLEGALTQPDMILLDINMPRWDGKDFMRAIREKGLVQHVPVNILSTYISEEDKMIFGQLGAAGFYRKTNTVPELVDLLRTILLHTNHHMLQRIVYPLSGQVNAGPGHPALAYRADR